MSLFVLSRQTVLNPGALDTGSVPRKHLHRIAILPRREASWGLILRLFVENEPLRYFVALTPFVVAMFIWRDLALPISQAPLAMIVVIGLVELRVLRLSKEKRAAITTEEAAARSLDTLAFRARAILGKIAARRSAAEGEIMLVVEQSELAGVVPLTLVSVQTEQGGPRVIDLDPEDRALIRDMLFDDALTERDLHRANLREDTFLRSIRFDLRGVSAHARLAALLAEPETAQEAPA